MATLVKVPAPGRHQYWAPLPEHCEIVLVPSEGEELCAGQRGKDGSIVIWTRKVQKKGRHGKKE